MENRSERNKTGSMNRNKDDRLVFIEGIPGSGKSTYAKRLLCNIKNNPESKVFYRNEKPSPLDPDRLAFFDKDQLQEFVVICNSSSPLTKETLIRELERFSTWEDDICAVNWFSFSTTCECNNIHTREFALAHEICAGKAGIDQYKKLTLKRWRRFSKERVPEAYYLFEGALFQHPLAELLGYYKAEDKEILDFVEKMLACLPHVIPVLIYIRVSDIKSILTNAAIERRQEEYSWWNSFCRWVETCPYGRTNQLSGMSGAVYYCKERMRLEKLIMNSIPIKLDIIDR